MNILDQIKSVMLDEGYERFHNIMDAIAEERYRQVAVLGHTQAKDDIYNREGQLARAACALADAAAYNIKTGHDVEEPFLWPWKDHDPMIKHKFPERLLIQAGALIVAQLEQLARLGK